MKKLFFFALVVACQLSTFTGSLHASNVVAANHPNIRYFGRWDFGDSLAPSHSWPGVYIYAEFEGTSIGVRMNDNYSYYNVFVDDTLASVFHGSVSGVSSYTLVSGLPDGHHTLLFTKRNETTWTKFTFNGFILDDGKNLLPPRESPAKKIEFIGDSFASASGNEWTDNTAPSDVTPYTNIYEGFGPIVARHYDAQYQMTSRSGYGLVLDYLGNYSGNIPESFDRTLCYTNLPLWDFEQWVPNLVVICLGLNDYNGFGGYSGQVQQVKRDLFKSRYHDFFSRIRDVYPGIRILAVAAHVDWIQNVVSEVVDEERADGKKDVFYTYFPYYAGGYVNNGHPTVATHHKIADRIIAEIDSMNAWQPYRDILPPKFVKLPTSPFVVYDTTTTLELQTDTYATARYSTQDKPYKDMEFTFALTGKRDHSVLISCQHNKQYTFYARAIDVFGNAMDTSAVIHFTVDTTKALLDWKSLAYDDSQWKTGASPLGSQDTIANKTRISQVTAAYFRKKIQISDLNTIVGFGLLIKGKDGAIVFVNGNEVQRINMFADADISYTSLAVEPKTLSTMVVMNAQNGLLSRLKTGENIVAIEMHGSSTDADISFDSQLFDSKNKLYYTLGSDWSYSDDGGIPPKQIRDKTAAIFSSGSTSLPKTFAVNQNYPNPFNPSTIISWQLPEKSFVELRLYDVLGREVAVLANSVFEAGQQQIEFSGAHLPSGTYFYNLAAGKNSVTKKMLLLK